MKFKIDKVAFNKYFSNVLRKARKKAKDDKCILCGEKISKVCNSHTVPRFVLEKVANNGFVYKTNSFLDSMVGISIKSEIGLNQAGTFKTICNNCDKTWFDCYENEEKLTSIFNDNSELKTKKLASIFLKSLLYNLSQKKTSKFLYPILRDDLLEFNKTNLLTNSDDVEELNCKELLDDIRKCISIINDKNRKAFKIVYLKELKHRAGITCQTLVALNKDLKGNVVNNVFNMNPKIKMHMLCIGIFPLSNSTLVLMYCLESAYNTYKNFIQQFNLLNEPDKLLTIQNIIFFHSVDVFISQLIYEKMISDEEFKNLCKQGFSTMDLGVDTVYHYTSVRIDNQNNIKNYLLLNII